MDPQLVPPGHDKIVWLHQVFGMRDGGLDESVNGTLHEREAGSRIS
jgi:hypothetical protein